MQVKPKRHIPPLLPPAVALCAGIFAARYFVFFPVTVSVSCLAACAAALSFRRLNAARRVLACIFLAAGFASFYMYGPGAPSYAGELATAGSSIVHGIVTSAPQEREGYTVVQLEPVDGPEGYRRAGLIRLTVNGTGLGIRYGDLLRAGLRLREPAGLGNPGAFDWGTYARLNGVDAVASVKPGALHRTGNSAGFLMRRVHAFRSSLIDKSRRSLGPASGAIFRAIILGDQGGVDQAMRAAFQASGTTHILSVSGSHIALLSGTVFFGIGALFGLLPAGWALRLSLALDIRKLGAAVAIPSAISYCLIAGSEVATVRATIMVCVFMVSILIDRQNQVINTLSAAALAVLLLDPSALFDISFRLSYLAVLFIALAIDAMRGWNPPALTGMPRFYRLFRRAALATVMSVAAIAGTAPLVAGQFNSFSYVALPANLVLLPLAGALAVPAGLVTCLVDAIAPGNALPLAWLNEAGLTAFHRIVGLFASAPGADLHPSAPGPFITSAYYIAAVAGLILPSGRGMKAAALAAAAACLLAAVMYHPGHGRMSVCFLDVGQGECAVAEFPDGSTMLIDCGGPPVGSDPGRAAAAPYLWNRGIRKLDYVVVSHPQPDHVSGLECVLAGFGAGQLWEGGLVSNEPGYAALRSAAEAGGVPRFVLQDKTEMSIGGVTVQALHTCASSVDDAGCESGTRVNDRSLVLRLAYRRVSFLFTGDVERQAQYAMLEADPPLPLRSTVLKVPHHGSSDACLPAFLDAVSPEMAVISAGRRNVFGHPRPVTLDALKVAGADVYCTSSDGAVTVETDGESLFVSTFESSRLRPASSWQDELNNFGRLLGPVLQEKRAGENAGPV